jgi:hypothetical protein
MNKVQGWIEIAGRPVEHIALAIYSEARGRRPVAVNR